MVTPARTVTTELLHAAGWMAAGASMIAAVIWADVALDLSLLEGGVRRDGGATDIVLVIVGTAFTLLGMVMCIWPPLRAAYSVIRRALVRFFGP